MQLTEEGVGVTLLHHIRQGPLLEATAAGEQFAKDADARLGKIKSANQGVFSIESRDPTDSWSSNERQAINKKVRVVATITFYLK